MKTQKEKIPHMKNSIELTQEQRLQLEEVIKSGSTAARKIQHAQVLLKIDSGKEGPNWSDEQIKEAFGVSPSTVWRIRQRFLEHGVDDAINRRLQPERPEKRKVTGEQEAQLIVLACTEAPTGHSQWSIRLLRKRVVELQIVEEVGRETIRLVLKRNELKPWLNKRFCIPPEANEEFVYNMEDVLDVASLVPMIHVFLKFAWMRQANSYLTKYGNPSRWKKVSQNVKTPNTSVREPLTYSGDVRH
jgi:transposase